MRVEETSVVEQRSQIFNCQTVGIAVFIAHNADQTAKKELNKTFVTYRVGKYMKSQDLVQPMTFSLNKKLVNLFDNLQCQARALISKFF